uniref:uncharacterized protein LOC117607422 n=1 Tax=Osmia lignaria TaxID=473952 RepID=UPI001478A3CE|nr:uncharacterized protein LOC117607422 [Osmia lignaria]
MSALTILVNCIILCVAFRGTFSMPKKIAVLTINTTDEVDDTQSVQRPTKLHWDQYQTRNMMVHGTVCVCNLRLRGKPPRDDYTYTAGIGSHKFHSRAKGWNTARKICNEEGGHLAVINSYAEQRALTELFKRGGEVVGSTFKDTAFLGLHDLYFEGDWVTILGDPLAVTGFTVWSSAWGGQPDNAGGVQHCAGMMMDGTMDDINCNIPYAFFCEIPELAPLTQSKEMSRLSILVNCIILCVAFRHTVSVPKQIAVVSFNKTENILISKTSDSSLRHPLESYWDELRNSDVNVHGTVCMFDLGIRGVRPREDYMHTPGIGSHKLHTRGQTWNTARIICNEEGGHLAIVNSDEEAKAMVRLFHIYGQFKDAARNDEAFIGTHDMYKEGDWATILGEPLAETGFTKWSNLFGGQPDNGNGDQNCGGFLNEGTLDDIHCYTRFAFICEIPEIMPL